MLLYRRHPFKAFRNDLLDRAPLLLPKASQSQPPDRWDRLSNLRAHALAATTLAIVNHSASQVEHEPSRRNSTADRAINVLLLFEERRPVLSAAEIGEHLGMSRSTTYRYLQSLRMFGFLEEVPGRDGFRLGPRIFQLARIARHGMGGLVELARPIMEELAEKTGEAVLLTRSSGQQVVCLERVESQHRVRLSYERGHTLPVHAGASAKVLLAYAGSSEIDKVLGSTKLPRFTDNTVTDPETLKHQLEEIRQAGYAISISEVDQGVAGVGAPVFSPNGEVEAGLSVAGPSFRLTEKELPGVIDAVRSAADRLTRLLGEVAG